MTLITSAWLAGNPLPVHGEGTDKNSRGRVLVAGGSLLVPGALRLTVEAAFRAGAGKVRAATVAPAALALGMRIPEAAVIALQADDSGEIAAGSAPILLDEIERCDAFVLGPGMGDRDRAAALVAALLDHQPAGPAILLDAAAIACARPFGALLRRHAGRLLLTPHHGEMAALTGRDEQAIAADPETAAADAARDFGAVVVLKATRTVIAAPDGALLRYEGGGVGLATGGSGDVLAGLIGGLLARGADPLTAAAWGVWLHGEAGTRLARSIGPIGFLARELLPEIPSLMASAPSPTAPSICHPRESGDPPSSSRTHESEKMDSRFRGNDIGGGEDRP